jgi:hypothetical protein
LEPTVIVVITDGHCFTSEESVQDEIDLALDDSEKNQLTKDSFRWDQRLFSIILKMSGVGKGSSRLLPGERALTNLCDSTGGRNYSVGSQKSLVQSLESLTQKLHPGVVVCFRKIGYTPPEPSRTIAPNSTIAMDTTGREIKTEGEPTPQGMGVVDEEGSAESWQCVKKMIYVKINPKTNVPTGHWPIPEAFWPEPNMKKLPPRNPNPIIWFRTKNVTPLLVESFPFDKYELEPSSLTRHILAMKDPNSCWEVYISNSGKEEGLTHPFGYLKSSSSLQSVNLFIMPFNYRRIIPLIDDLIRNHMKPPPNWRHEFAEFISTLPSYYSQPLRNAMRLLGANPALVPDFFDGQLSPEVTSLLKRLRKQAKLESERIMSIVAKNKIESDKQKKRKMQLYFGPEISVAIGSPGYPDTKPLWRTNPFDVTRSNLLDELKQIRQALTRKRLAPNSLARESLNHEVPISQMGNYQEHLKRINPLRGVETGTVKTQLFGNPYRLEKNDAKRDTEEADEHMVNLGQSRRRSRSLSRGLRGRSRSPSPAPVQPQSSSSTTNERIGTDKEYATSMSSSQSGNKQPTNLEASEPVSEPMDHSGRTSPHSQPDSNSMLADGSVSRGEKDTSLSNDVSHLTRKSSENASVRKGNVRLLKKEERKRSPSPIDLTGVPPLKKERQLSTDHPLKGNHLSKNKSIPGSLPALHSPLLSEGSSAAKVLTEEFQKQQGQENAKIKASILKEFKKPGKNHDGVLHLLNSVKGPVDVQRMFLQEIIKEAKKWKRKGLLEQLEKRAANLLPAKETDEPPKKVQRSFPKKPGEGGATSSGNSGDGGSTSSGSTGNSGKTSSGSSGDVGTGSSSGSKTVNSH